MSSYLRLMDNLITQKTKCVNCGRSRGTLAAFYFAKKNVA